MASWYTSRAFGLGACAAAAACAVAGWLVFRGGPPPPGGGFRECAEEAGLRWRMRFLPNEQGAAFKINLYDHGCGLAAADFDGDGLDDLYFCNQLGPNALYRNNGDGTFTDVSER